MRKNDVELSNIIPFREDGCWYLKLIYKYDDENGNKHIFIIPKASVPFVQGRIPLINWDYNWLCNKTLNTSPYINCEARIPLHNGVYTPESEPGEAKLAGVYFDIVTDYAIKEMSLTEIEKELGYKVKIVNKENKNV